MNGLLPQSGGIQRGGQDVTEMALPKVGVLAVVERHGRFLLVQRRNPPDAGLWGFPGGKQHAGETVFAAAARELMEETGVCAVPAAHLAVIDAMTKEAGTKEAGSVADGGAKLRFHYTLIAVRLDWREGEGVAADDALAVTWANTDTIGELPCSRHVGTLMAIARGIALEPAAEAAMRISHMDAMSSGGR